MMFKLDEIKRYYHETVSILRRKAQSNFFQNGKLFYKATVI